MRFNIGTVGYTLHFTSQIPADAARVLSERGDEYAAFDLTPNWGEVPELPVRRLAEAGLDVPSHWNLQDVVVPIIHGQAFYIGDIGLGGGGVSFSMKGVNLRTGKPETEGPLSDEPSQSYWAPGVYLPWIDGYVPSDGQAVRQFVPRKGEAEMATDVARFVGISDDDPYIDALRARFFAPLEPKNVPAYDPMDDYLGGGAVAYAMPGLESLGAESVEVRSISPVGMGAGARMRQRHEHNPDWAAGDFRTTPWLDIVFRLVWVEEWNKLAQQAGKQAVTDDQLARFKRYQAEYESRVRRQLGIFQHVATDVNTFPQV